VKISVVIAALNEAAELPATLAKAGAVPEVVETIVSDGGSTDATRDIAAASGARVVTGARGRGMQFRLGAEQALGEVVWLLHADTWPSPQAGAAIAKVLQDSRIVGGAFYKTFRDPHWLMRGSRFRCWLRMRTQQFAYGDQALFVRREVLEKVGGVPAVPLMEEHELCRQLRRVGRLRLADATVTTSARRFHERGVLRTYWRMAATNLRWHLGASPEELRQFYQRP
jgi:rSAM/selenodomain-associated transferase 2